MKGLLCGIGKWQNGPTPDPCEGETLSSSPEDSGHARTEALPGLLIFQGKHEIQILMWNLLFNLDILFSSIQNLFNNKVGSGVRFCSRSGLSASSGLEFPALGVQVGFGVVMRGSLSLAEAYTHLSALSRTRKQDCARDSVGTFYLCMSLIIVPTNTVILPSGQKALPSGSSRKGSEAASGCYA